MTCQSPEKGEVGLRQVAPEEGPLSRPQTVVPRGSVGKLVLPQPGAWALIERNVESRLRAIGQTVEESFTGASDGVLPGPNSKLKVRLVLCIQPVLSHSPCFSKAWEAWGLAGIDDLGGGHWQWCQGSAAGQREVAGSTPPLGGWREKRVGQTHCRQGLLEDTQWTSLTIISLFIR